MEYYTASKMVFKMLILIFITIPLNLLAQQTSTNSSGELTELFNLAESSYPINDEYINGFIYPVPKVRILGDPYFNTKEWVEGSLFINGRTYSGIFMKYDLIIDELIIKVKTELNIERLLAINKSQVDSFKIGSSLFVNSGILFENENRNTYYEKIYKGKLSVYRQFQKTFIEMYNSSSPEGKFSAQKSNIYILQNNEFTNINSAKSFFACFDKPEQEKIRRYLKSKNITYKKMTDSQMIDLMNFCNTNISQ
ncbi:MAG TPA: hypothetical protein PLC80_16485 [Draconibacterium sp.]|nr:hypothetical protein [Draconibacterium sp.]